MNAGRVGGRVIDADGHIIEDMVEIAKRMPQPYRKIAERSRIVFPPLDHLHEGRAVETPPARDGRKPVGREGWLEFLEDVGIDRSEEHTSELQSLMRIADAVFCLKKKKK